MLMYKDGVTRTVEDYDVQRFKDMGYVEVEQKPVEEEPKPKRKRED